MTTETPLGEQASAGASSPGSPESGLAWAAIIDTVPDGLIVINDKGVVQSLNPVAEKQFGYRAAEVIGRNISTLMPQPYRDQHDGHLARYLATGERRIIGVGRIVLGQRADGSTFPMELRIGEFRAGAARLFAGYVRDVTERQRDRYRLQELQSELFRASRVSVTGEMVSALAHELNQPLTAVISYVRACARLMERDNQDRDLLYEVMDKAIAQANRAGQIIRHLRQFLRKGAAEHTIENVNSLIEEASALALVGAREGGVHVHMDLGADLPEVVIDRIQIQQVVLNLVRNAIEALAGAAQREITISTRPAGGQWVEIAVSDTGPGLPADVASRLFQPFVTTKESGMGLGLKISQSIVEAHGGQLRAAPNADGGVTFRFELPANTATD